MSDLEKVLKIAEEIEEKRIKKYEDILMAFMKKQSRFALKNLDPWILSAGGVQYLLDDLKCSKLSQSDLNQAAQNLGFQVNFSDATEFSISVSNSEVPTLAKQLFNDYENAFTKEKERIENLTNQFYNDLMDNINKKENINVRKNKNSFFISVKLPIPKEAICFKTSVQAFMESKGFKNILFSNGACMFDAPFEHIEEE